MQRSGTPRRSAVYANSVGEEESGNLFQEAFLLIRPKHTPFSALTSCLVLFIDPELQ